MNIHYFLGLLPLFSLILLIQIMYKKGEKNWRSAVVSASLFWGFFIVLITELLSYFVCISQLYLSIIWILSILVLTIVWIKKRCYTFFKYIKFSYNIIPIFIIILFTGFIAITYPPNNWDSMTYHLPKVEEWLQNGTLKHFETSIVRQNVLAPFAEMCILQFRGLSGSDYLVNIVQWLCYIGVIINVSLITYHLNGNTKYQIFSSIFCATIPMAILQSSSTQTDLVVSYWLTCFIERFLQWLETPKRDIALGLGIALGLACLTKGTAYIVAFPFVIGYVFLVLKNSKKFIYNALLAACVVILINVPHLIRNYDTYGDPLGRVVDHYMPAFSVKGLGIALLGNLLSNEPPLPQKIQQNINNLVSKTLNFTNISPTDPQYIEPGSNLLHLPDKGTFHEDITGNPIHTILIAYSILYFFVSLCKNYKNYYLYYILLMYIISIFSFLLLLKWNFYITRLQLPIYILGSPIVSIMLQNINKKYFSYFIFFILVLYAVLPVLFNTSRPLLISSKMNTNKMNIWSNSREELYFSNRPHMYKKYKEAVNLLKYNNSKNIGLVIGSDSWEYPLWKMLRQENSNPPIIKHICINSTTIPKNIDAIFVFDSTSPICQKFSITEMHNPQIIFIKN